MKCHREHFGRKESFEEPVFPPMETITLLSNDTFINAQNEFKICLKTQKHSKTKNQKKYLFFSVLIYCLITPTKGESVESANLIASCLSIRTDLMAFNFDKQQRHFLIDTEFFN